MNNEINQIPEKKSNKKIFMIFGVIIIAAVLVIAVVLFVYPYDPIHPPIADDSGSTQQGIQEVINSNNKFALDLYNKYKDIEENIFFSPYSISSALAMTYEGAKGETAEEIKNVFYFPEISVLRPNFAAIYNNINEGIGEYELRTGNALWVQQDYPLLENYKNNIEKYYGGKAANLDFIQEAEKSRQTINSFIEEQTNNKIKDLIPQGTLNELTRLVLTNAIYFKGTWEWEFEDRDTRDKDFKINSEETIQVPMMYMKNDKASFNYADLEKLQILELPYKGDKISMLILLPKQGEDYDFETEEIIVSNYTLEDIELSSEKLNEYKSQMSENKLDAIYLPKFEFKTKYNMKKDLIEMGMPSAFEDPSLLNGADFSGMNGKKELYIQNVIHQAYIKVDEKGTEAAAATAVVVGIMAVMPEKIFNADHPFIFIIQDKETGNILFMGKVVNPKGD